MPDTEQLLSYDDQADYYQLWKEKIYENTCLSKKLINSKEKVISLQMKLIDFICSVKSLEAELDIDPSEEVKKLLQTKSCQTPEKDNMGMSDQRISSFLQPSKPVTKEPDTNQNLQQNNDFYMEKIIPIQEGEKAMFKCRICKKVFALPSNLRDHLRTQHGSEQKSGTAPSSEKRLPACTEPRTFQCRICDKKFKLSIQLARHQQIHKYDKSHRNAQQVSPKGMTVSDSPVPRTSQVDGQHPEPTPSAIVLNNSTQQQQQETEIVIPGSISLQLSQNENARTTFEYNLNPSDGISSSVDSNSQSANSEDVMITSNLPEPQPVEATIKTEDSENSRTATEKSSTQNAKQKPYAIVEFEENQVGVVCTSWLFDRNSKCYWPPDNPSKMTMDCVTPTASWEPCDIVHVLSFAESYNEAQYKLRKSEYTSELSSDSSDVEKKKRKVRKKKRLSDSFVEEVEDGSGKEKSKSADPVMLSCTVNLEHLNIPSDQNEQALILPTSLSEENRYAVNLIGDLQTFPSEDQGFEAGGDVSFYVEEVKEQLYHHEILLTQILKCLQPLPALPEVHGIPNFPLGEIQELNHLENMLMQEDVRSYMVAKLGSIGGNNVSDITRRIMKFLMKPSLSLLLNWCGQRGKFGFKNFKLKDIVIDAVRENANFKASKDKDVEDNIKQFLKHSKDREGGRFVRTVRHYETGNLFSQGLGQVHYSNNV